MPRSSKDEGVNDEGSGFRVEDQGIEAAAGCEVGSDSLLGWSGGVSVLVAVVAELRSGFLHSGGKCAASGRNDIIFSVCVAWGRSDIAFSVTGRGGEVGDDDVAGALTVPSIGMLVWPCAVPWAVP